jgi:hypothetical protein
MKFKSNAQRKAVMCQLKANRPTIKNVQSIKKYTPQQQKRYETLSKKVVNATDSEKKKAYDLMLYANTNNYTKRNLKETEKILKEKKKDGSYATVLGLLAFNNVYQDASKRDLVKKYNATSVAFASRQRLRDFENSYFNRQ